MSKKPSAESAITSGKIAGAKTVTVGCKSPNGLLLRIFKEEEVTEATQSGPKTFKQSFPDDKAGTVEIKGYGGAAFGIKQDHRIIGQYALTHNVDADFMRKWMEQNQDSDLVKNKLIFIQADEADAAAQGIEQKGIWDGLHPLRMGDPTKKDPRVPRKLKTYTKKDKEDDDTLSSPAAA